MTTDPRPFPGTNGSHLSRSTPTEESETPQFEGRPLDRPGEDIEDQGLAFDLRTLTSRRRMLGFLGLGTGAAALAACGLGSSSSSSGATSSSATAPATQSAAATTATAGGTEMPTETAGPYPGDGSNGPDVLDETGVERSDIRTSIGSAQAVDGVPLKMTLRIKDMANGNAPFAGTAVYLWHCNAEGKYSMYSDGVTGETWCRGVQVADAAGEVTFTTVYPGCYSGRWPHIHFEVFASIDDITDASRAILTSQIALPEQQNGEVYAATEYSGSADNLARITLDSDNVFSDGWDMQLPEISGSAATGYTASIAVPIDTRTVPTQAAAPGGPGGSGGPGGAGGPGGMPPGAPPSGAPAQPAA